MNLRKLNEEIEKVLAMNEISDELRGKVANKRKEQMQKAIDKYANNQALNKKYEKNPPKKATTKVDGWEQQVSGDIVKVTKQAVPFQGDLDELAEIFDRNFPSNECYYDLPNTPITKCTVDISCEIELGNFDVRLDFNEGGEIIGYISFVCDLGKLQTIIKLVIPFCAEIKGLDKLGKETVEDTEEETKEAPQEREAWSYFGGGLSPSISFGGREGDDYGLYLYAPCPEESYYTWNLYVGYGEYDDDENPTAKFLTPPSIEDIVKGIKRLPWLAELWVSEDILPDYKGTKAWELMSNFVETQYNGHLEEICVAGRILDEIGMIPIDFNNTDFKSPEVSFKYEDDLYQLQVHQYDLSQDTAKISLKDGDYSFNYLGDIEEVAREISRAMGIVPYTIKFWNETSNKESPFVCVAKESRINLDDAERVFDYYAKHRDSASSAVALLNPSAPPCVAITLESEAPDYEYDEIYNQFTYMKSDEKPFKKFLSQLYKV